MMMMEKNAAKCDIAHNKTLFFDLSFFSTDKRIWGKYYTEIFALYRLLPTPSIHRALEIEEIDKRTYHITKKKSSSSPSSSQNSE